VISNESWGLATRPKTDHEQALARRFRIKIRHEVLKGSCWPRHLAFFLTVPATSAPLSNKMTTNLQSFSF
jgi:hypothetical protein